MKRQDRRAGGLGEVKVKTKGRTNVVKRGGKSARCLIVGKGVRVDGEREM